MSIAQALSNSAPKKKKLNGMIVIADNDPQSMASIAAAFEKVGWRVATARNGDEAVDIIDAAKVNAIMLNVSLPEIIGCDVCRQLLDLGKKIPTMMISGCMDNEQSSGPVDIEGTTIKLVTAEELQAFSNTAPKRFVWRGDAPDIVVTRKPGHRSTPVCRAQSNASKLSPLQPG